jgi:hypothetical protein
MTVDEDRAEKIARLRTVRLFRALKEPELERVAELFTWMDVPAGTDIIREGARGDAFYILVQGEVTVTTTRSDRPPAGHGSKTPSGELRRLLNVHGPGDYFGEGSLLTGRPRRATVTSKTNVRLLHTDEAGFGRMIADFPSVKPLLALNVSTYDLVARRRLAWLDPEEVVLIFATKHWYLLLEVIWGIIALALLFSVGYLASLVVLGWNDIVLYGYLGVMTVLLLWFLWHYIDWSNDFYLITNRRVVHEERVVLIYDARVEAPLHTLRNVAVKLDRNGQIFGFGDVLVQTFAGTLNFHGVAHPEAMANLILDLVARERRRQVLSEREAIYKELVKQVRPGPPAPETPAAPPAPLPPRHRTSLRDVRLALADALNLQTRVEVQGVITYRKHPWVLITEAWIPILALLALFVFNALRVFSALTGMLQFMDLDFPLCGLEFVLSIPFLAWLWYRYEDWRNDIYQLTNESIFDIERTPLFGKEERRQAPLDAVLNVQVNRPNFFAVLLNFGDVIVQTGGKSGEMTFNSVFDPLAVQQDVWRKFEVIQSRKREADAQRQRQEMAKWFREYHRVLRELPPEG